MFVNKIIISGRFKIAAFKIIDDFPALPSHNFTYKQYIYIFFKLISG